MVEKLLHFAPQRLMLLLNLLAQHLLQLAHFNLFSLRLLTFGLLPGLGLVIHGILHHTGVLLLS